ncbi:MAG: sugar MFS transporter, partial [Bacteroidales bacterium]|nr:sugar MFS transporter [Bacteroidales bacterium]
MGKFTGQASGLLTVGFLGGAVIPVIQGALADNVAIGLQKSFFDSLHPLSV